MDDKGILYKRSASSGRVSRARLRGQMLLFCGKPEMSPLYAKKIWGRFGDRYVPVDGTVTF